jgi:CheY-like chemotaxis protein
MTDADGGATETRPVINADLSSPLILLIDPDPVRRAGRGAELRRAWARVAELADASRVTNALRAAQVDVVVVCADDPTTCQQLVHEARAQITASEASVPLIAWQVDAAGPCGSRAIMLHIGADSVLEAPSSTTDLLASAYALRRLMRDVYLRG